MRMPVGAQKGQKYRKGFALVSWGHPPQKKKKGKRGDTADDKVHTHEGWKLV